MLGALRELSENYLVEKILGGRTAKYAHCLTHVLSMEDRERAVLTVLLLRGTQTAGEIKQRTERLHHFDTLEEVEEILTWFIEYPHGPLVRRIPVGGGRRVESFAHLLSEEHSGAQSDLPGPGPVSVRGESVEDLSPSSPAQLQADSWKAGWRRASPPSKKKSPPSAPASRSRRNLAPRPGDVQVARMAPRAWPEDFRGPSSRQRFRNR